jgi:hypothetical protein
MKTRRRQARGARAVIEHLVEWDKDGGMETHHYLATLLRSPVLAEGGAHEADSTDGRNRCVGQLRGAD